MHLCMVPLGYPYRDTLARGLPRFAPQLLTES